MGPTEMCYSKEGNVGVIRLEGPVADGDSLAGRAALLKDVQQEVAWDGNVHCVVVSGPGAFAAGPGSYAAYVDLLELDLRRLLTPASVLGSINKPLIAAIESEATGPGLELALACDLRICAESSKFALNHLPRGAFPMDGGLQRLARLIGRGDALRLALLAEEVDAEEAHRLGLVHRVVPGPEVLPTALAMAKTLGDMAPYAVRYAKEAILKGMEMPLEQAIRLEADLYLHLHSTADRAEGITAFREKRPPKFEGR